jgi:cytochrome P450
MPRPARPPGPRGFRLLAAIPSAIRFPPRFLQRVAERYGDIACIKAGPIRVYLVSSPALAEDLLEDHEKRFEKVRGEQRFTRRLLDHGVLASAGKFHRHQHHLLIPPLHGHALDPYAAVVVDRATAWQANWTSGGRIDAVEQAVEVCVDVMVEMLFGVRVSDPRGQEVRRTLTDAIAAMERLRLPGLSWTDDLPLPSNRRFARARKRLDEMVFEMIRARRDGTEGGEDVLTALVHITDEQGKAMEDHQIRDEILTLFRASRTTATALGWTWHLLNQHADVEAKVLAEIDEAIGDDRPTAETLDRLPFTRRVVDEALRLYPPAWMMARRVVTELDMAGYRLPVGSTVITSPWVIHRDARNHPNPEAFDPDRFASDRRAEWARFAYFPFGGGTKKCLGDQLAPFQVLLIMATINRRWRLRPAPGSKVEPAPKATLKLRHGLDVVLEPRGRT